MRGALAGGGEVVRHDALPDVIMCYPAPSSQQREGDGGAVSDVSHAIPLAHEVFITARTAEVFPHHSYLVTRHTSHVLLSFPAAGCLTRF